MVIWTNAALSDWFDIIKYKILLNFVWRCKSVKLGYLWNRGYFVDCHGWKSYPSITRLPKEHIFSDLFMVPSANLPMASSNLVLQSSTFAWEPPIVMFISMGSLYQISRYCGNLLYTVPHHHFVGEYITTMIISTLLILILKDAWGIFKLYVLTCE